MFGPEADVACQYPTVSAPIHTKQFLHTRVLTELLHRLVAQPTMFDVQLIQTQLNELHKSYEGNIDAPVDVQFLQRGQITDL